MALSIRPADALIHRLLQQNSRVADVRDTSPKSKAPVDQVNISAEAKSPDQTRESKQGYAPTSYNSTYKQADLEARLLRLSDGSSDLDRK